MNAYYSTVKCLQINDFWNSVKMIARLWETTDYLDHAVADVVNFRWYVKSQRRCVSVN